MTPPQSREKPVRSILVYGSVDPDVCNACVLHLSGIANAFARQGVDVTLMAPKAEPGAPLITALDDGVKYVAFSRPHLGSKTIWTFGPLFSLLSFWRQLKTQRPDLLYVRMSLLTWPLHWLANRRAISSIAEHNGIISVELSRSRIGRLLRPLMERFQLWSCELASMSRAVTQGMKTQLVELGAEEHKIVVLGNGTDVENMARQDRVSSLNALGLDESRFYIGFLGSLSWWQGVHTLVAGFARAQQRIPNLHLLIGGDGTERQNLQAQAQTLEIEDNVTFLGHVDFSARMDVLSAMDIATLPACAERNQEQGISPLKVRDYSAVGSVILAADLPGLEAMTKADAIVLHKPDDADDLADKIIALYEDRERQKLLAKNSREFAEQQYSWTVIGQRVLEVAGRDSKAATRRM